MTFCVEAPGTTPSLGVGMTTAFTAAGAATCLRQARGKI